MFAKRHHYIVRTADNGRDLQYVCCCGAKGWTTPSTNRAHQMGEKHVATAKARAKANQFRFKI
ncbi:hypothetical protein [Streptomyces acidiscabies]|uniref:hypothetical protein n=1 Tax=Streptomyces acidiscabies TaxID=42234 RepID=UPI0038F615B8